MSIILSKQAIEQQLKIKRSGLRRIDQGTRYDITGRLRSLARRIENGEYGDVRGVVIGLNAREGCSLVVTTLDFGMQSAAEKALTLGIMANKAVS